MPCNGVCDKYKVSAGSGARYTEGKKRCTECEIFTMWEGKFCPCCHQQLRVHPLKSAEKRRNRKILKEIPA